MNLKSLEIFQNVQHSFKNLLTSLKKSLNAVENVIKKPRNLCKSLTISLKMSSKSFKIVQNASHTQKNKLSHGANPASDKFLNKFICGR
jgi:hypothetical protein